MAAVMQPVRAIVCTLDGASKLFANMAAGPAKVLRKSCKLALAIIDE